MPTACILALTLAATPAPARLPLTSLIFYENGVGYFERRGALQPGQVAELPLAAGQLDDALKSLVVVSAQGVASVEFAAPLAADAARAMAGMPEPAEQRAAVTVLRALQGLEVEVERQGQGLVRGRVLEVSEDEKDFDKEGHPLDAPRLMLFGEAGLVKLRLDTLVSVRPVDPGVRQAWSRAAAALARQPERERLMVRGSGAGGPVAVGYTTEAPVWRTTYRLVLGRGKPRLQGFALVHNDSDEPWAGVSVSIASGRPSSFLFPLAGPRYGRRDLVTPADGLETAPQLATREAQEHLRGPLGGEGGATVALGSLGASGRGSGGGGISLGGHSSVAGVAVTSTVLEDGPTPLEPAAVSEAGDLFLYRVKEPVHLGARKSALLPIIDGPVQAERVSLLTSQGEVRSGVRLVNSTPLTLEGGTLAVFTDGAFAGETQVDRVKPGEVRVVPHGEELDLEVSRTTERERGPVRRAAVIAGPRGPLLQLTRVDKVIHTLALHSRTAQPRVLLVALDDARARLAQGAEEDVRSPGQPRYARLEVPAHQERTLTLVDEGAVEERRPASQLSVAQVSSLLQAGVDGRARVVLERVLGELRALHAAQTRHQHLEARLKGIEADLARVREDLAALGRTNQPLEAARRLSDRLLDLETSLTQVRRERDEAAELAKTREAEVLASKQPYMAQASEAPAVKY